MVDKLDVKEDQIQARKELGGNHLVGKIAARLEGDLHVVGLESLQQGLEVVGKHRTFACRKRHPAAGMPIKETMTQQYFRQSFPRPVFPNEAQRPGTEKEAEGLYAEAVRCTLLVGRKMKTEVPGSLSSGECWAAGERVRPITGAT